MIIDSSLLQLCRLLAPACPLYQTSQKHKTTTNAVADDRLNRRFIRNDRHRNGIVAGAAERPYSFVLHFGQPPRFSSRALVLRPRTSTTATLSLSSSLYNKRHVVKPRRLVVRGCCCRRRWERCDPDGYPGYADCAAVVPLRCPAAVDGHLGERAAPPTRRWEKRDRRTISGKGRVPSADG